MTKAQFVVNVVLFLPLLVLDFFAYGIDGCARFVNEMNRYTKKYISKD